MTGKQLLEALHRMSPEELDLPIVGIVGSSGESLELGSISPSEQEEDDGGSCGILCDVPEGTKYLSLYLGK